MCTFNIWSICNYISSICFDLTIFHLSDVKNCSWLTVQGQFREHVCVCFRRGVEGVKGKVRAGSEERLRSKGAKLGWASGDFGCLGQWYWGQRYSCPQCVPVTEERGQCWDPPRWVNAARGRRRLCGTNCMTLVTLQAIYIANIQSALPQCWGRQQVTTGHGLRNVNSYNLLQKGVFSKKIMRTGILEASSLCGQV